MKPEPYFLALALAVHFGAALADDAKPAPPPPSAEFQKGWCAGWSVAVATMSQHYANWRSQVMAGRTAPPQNADAAIGAIVDGVALYVLITPLTGKVDLPGGNQVDCTPEPAPADQPAPAQ
jgi:hypothetical protein